MFFSFLHYRLFKNSLSIKSTPENQIVKRSKGSASSKKLKTRIKSLQLGCLTKGEVELPSIRNTKNRSQICPELFELSSHDSGYEGTDDQDSRSSIDSPKSSSRSSASSSISESFACRNTVIHDLSKFEDFEDLELDSITPEGFNKLLTSQIANTPESSASRSLFRLDLDQTLTDSENSPAIRPLKRLNSPESSPSPTRVKRSRNSTYSSPAVRSAVHRSSTDGDLIGDFSKSCVLPLVEGRQDDLKSISSTTLCQLIRGDFAHQVNHFQIVDCRYPYEYEGGHIVGAVNLYTKDSIQDTMMNYPSSHEPTIELNAEKRSVVVFYCEFSIKRGPDMLRFLRSIDREHNADCYPKLYYPEMYLLDGGYETFFREFKEICIPQSYKPMKDGAHEAYLRQLKIKSRTWQGENVSRITLGGGKVKRKKLDF